MKLATYLRSHSARLIVPLLAGLIAWPASAEVINIDNAELARLAAKGVPVIDIRTAGEWKSTGVIPGSKLLTFFDEKGNANSAQWLASAKGIATPDQPVILICRSGNRSRAAAQVLSREGGYGRVYNVSRGVQGWAGEGRTFVAPTSACLAGERC